MKKFFYNRLFAALVLAVSVVSAESLKLEHFTHYAGEYQDLAVDNGFAYLLEEDDLISIDLSGFGINEEPYVMGAKNYALAVSGNHAYAFNECQFKVYDITDPYYPVQISSLDAFNNSDYQCSVYDIKVYNTSAVITYLRNGRYVYHELIDISDVNEPDFKTDAVDTSSLEDGYLIYSYNYFAYGFSAVGIKDINDLASDIATYYTSAGMQESMKVDGLAWSDTYMYVGYNNLVNKDGFDIVDISEPENPIFIDFYETSSNVLAVEEGYLYTIDNGYLKILDVRDPMNITVAAEDREIVFENIKKLVVKDSYVYVISSNRGFDSFYVRPVFTDPDTLSLLFLDNLYHNILNRDPDEGGLAYWDEQLKYNLTASEVVRNFFNSSEFFDASVEDEEFLKRLYSAILNREADETGLQFWMEQLQSDKSRESVIDDFIASDEFYAMAVRYGLNP